MSKVVFLTGAGLSAESGIKTFRDHNGIWNNYDVMEVCSIQGFRKNRQLVLDFYDLRRADLADKEPNLAHFMIAEMQKKFPGQIINLTQNVDNLLEKAGCEEVIHLHGELTKLFCEKCKHVIDIGYDSIRNFSHCPQCQSEKMRHFVVMFGESAPNYTKLYDSLQGDVMLVVIGTSGNVLPVDSFASKVKFSVLNNLEPQAEIQARCFDKVIYAPAGQTADQISRLVEEFMMENN